MNTSIGKMIYEGKAKKVFQYSDDAEKVFLEFKDSLTAFNAQKKGSFDNKGPINRDIAVLIFEYLEKKGIQSHFLESIGERGMLVQQVTIIPFEVVVRNWLAGSTAKKLGIAEGKILKKPLVEFYLKNDDLADPFVSDDQMLMMELIKSEEIVQLKELALKINGHLVALFERMNLTLVDFKIEFGKNKKNEIILADEITPDCCRLWDKTTQEKYDKDRFRRDLGSVKESYIEVLNRMKKVEGGLS
ncbi:MAG: phosphoribosylaminoimidazolesuccinocarboxamide synthase [Bdellovibrionota bacterium]